LEFYRIYASKVFPVSAVELIDIHIAQLPAAVWVLLIQAEKIFRNTDTILFLL
jgi:hypothetical protein